MISIGLFDSGVGGLTVARQIFHRMPGAKVIYYGDTARVPYGGKPAEELIYLADVITGFLIEQGADVVVDACNSTSAVALEHLKATYHIPIIGVVEPGVRAALKATQNGKIGLLATEATVNSNMHHRQITAMNPEVVLYAQACPRFVPLIERGEIDGPGVKEVAEQYLRPLQEAGIDTLILGCTHYPFLTPVLTEILGPEINLVDPAGETVSELADIIAGQHRSSDAVPEHVFYVSGDHLHFKEIGNLLLTGYKMRNVEKIFVG